MLQNFRALRALLALVFVVGASRARGDETAALSNLSVRTTLAANQTLIVGGVLSGGAKSILFRGGGPALAKFSLAGMADPRLALYTTGTTPLATNDDWPASLGATFTAVGAFAFDAGSKDAALVQSLDGSFTVQAIGATGGVILVEAYDVAGGLSPRLINVSARNRVGTGADVLIAGFTITGSGTKTLLVRGVGPGLAAFHLTGTLNDPLLKIYDSQNNLIDSNDNWSAGLASTMEAAGAFALPANSKDAALIVRLAPGAYSAVVSGADGGVGDGIVEIYEIASPAAPITVPGAPIIGLATAGNAQASITFNAPASNGGAAITSYVAVSSPGSFIANGPSSPLTVTGLTNGTSYTFTVTAVNSAGVSATSAASNAITPAVTVVPATAPGAPVIGAATAGNAQASVSFTAPASNGGAGITSYTVTSSPGGFTATGAASPLTVTGLTNGTSYTFKVTATNSAGTSAASAASNAVTPAAAAVPATVPGAPVIGAATAGNAQATVSFTAPASNGGAAITSYVAVSSPGSVIANGSSSPLTVTGLTNGTSYTFTVTAINSVGASAASAASNAVTPATVPGAPVIGTATGGNAQASVAFTVPASDGGAGITSYTVTSNPGGFTATGTTSPLTVSGLANGTSYTFTVTATNSVGTGAASVASNAVTPANTSAGSLTEARLPNTATSSNNVALGFPRMSPALPSTGNIRLKVIFVDFSDAPAASSRTPQSVFGMISPGSENLWHATSYGKLTLTLDPVYTWLRMSKPSGQYFPFNTNAAHKVYIQEAVNLAVAAGADFSACDSVAVMANPDATVLTNGPTFIAGSTGNGITAGSKTFTVAITSGNDLLFWGYKWLNHEGCHMMGLADLYAFTGATHRFVGDFSLMGLISGPAPEYLGWERWLLGWLDDSQILPASHGTANYTLTPIETAGGNKLLVIPTGTTTAVVVEYRQALGYDTAIVKTGPLVYSIDTSIATGNGVVKVLPINDADTAKDNNPLSVGQTITYNGVSVKCVSADATGTTLQVVRP